MQAYSELINIVTEANDFEDTEKCHYHYICHLYCSLELNKSCTLISKMEYEAYRNFIRTEPQF